MMCLVLWKQSWDVEFSKKTLIDTDCGQSDILLDDISSFSDIYYYLFKLFVCCLQINI